MKYEEIIVIALIVSLFLLGVLAQKSYGIFSSVQPCEGTCELSTGWCNIAEKFAFFTNSNKCAAGTIIIGLILFFIFKNKILKR